MAKYIEGERIYLRPVKKSDYEELDALMDDWQVLADTGSVYPNTEKELEALIERCQDTNDRVWFVIIDKATNKIIGETGFLHIFYPWRTSDFTLELWDKSFWGKGIGKETAKLMFAYGFGFLNLHRLAVGVVEKNARAVKFWKSVGFREEGRQVQGYYSDGAYSDFVMMYLLEDDCRENRLS